MIFHPVAQYSEAWWILRRGRPTASGLNALVTPTYEVRTGAMPETYLYEKLSELILNAQDEESGGSFAQDQGSLLEHEAKKFLEFAYDWKIKPGGFITDDAMRTGASPDGILGDSAGIEIKCPQPKNALRYLLEGVVPKEYRVQVQASLYISGFKEWWFVSYQRKLPPLVVRVEPDPVAQKALGEALTAFLKKFDDAVAKIAGMTPKTKAA